MMDAAEIKSPFRDLWLWCFVIASLLIAAIKITSVRCSTGEVPFLSANDRSRWATVASLVDYRTYAIDAFQNYRDPKTKRRTWQSIDRVEHRGRDGKIHSYSSKPPLLATIVAGFYALLKTITSWSIQKETFLVVRTLLILVNLPLLALMHWSVIDVLRRHVRHRWSLLFLTAALTCGTLLLPFAVTLSNHLPAAASVALALCMFDRQAFHGPSPKRMFLAGLAAAFAVANELPALAIIPFWGLLALRYSPRWTILAFMPATALVAIPFFATNYLAHNSLRPPYAHRGLGTPLATLAPRQNIEEARPQLATILNASPDQLIFTETRTPNRLRVDTPSSTAALELSPTAIVVSDWDDWYDYPGTYWTEKNLRGVDRGEPSRARYAWHVLVGHHGVFSLTPVWLLSLVGPFFAFFRSNGFLQKIDPEPFPCTPKFPAYTLYTVAVFCAVTLICLGFYLSRPLIDRNYGGVSICFRWLLWLIPGWLLLATAAVDWLSERRWGRWLCLGLLLMSGFSVWQSLDQPWSHPWLYRLLGY